MALVLPAPVDAQETAADALIRSIEARTPILVGYPTRGWLLGLLDAKLQPGADVCVATLACVRILRYLPVTDVHRQWALLVLLRETESAGLTPNLRVQIDNVRNVLEGLHRVGTADPPPSPEQLAAEARRLGDVFLAPASSANALTLEALRAFRAGYVVLRERLVAP